MRPEQLDLGELWEEKSFRCKLEIENTSTESVEITEFIPTCVCMNIEPRGLVISPGERRQIRLTLDLTFRPPEQADAAIWDFSTKLLARLDQADQRTVTWTLRARVRSLFALSTRRVYFWSGIVRGQTLPTQTVNVSSHQPLEDVKSSYDPSLLVVRMLPEGDNASKYTLEITPHPDMRAGIFSTDIQILGTTAAGIRPPPTTLTVMGWMREDVEAMPGTLGFGVQPVGHTTEGSVRLQSVSDTPFTVEAIEADGSDVKVARVPDWQDQHLYRVTQVVRQAGTRENRVRFIVRAPSGRTITVPLVITHCGLDSREPGLTGGSSRLDK
jgi:hypothetical protein